MLRVASKLRVDRFMSVKPDAVDRPALSMTHPSESPAWSETRWRRWGLGAGLLAGVVDTAGMRALGFSLEIGGVDVTVPVAIYFGVSFAVLGYLLGYLVEQRRRERFMAAMVQRQMETLADLRSRVAQSEKLAALGQLAAAIAHEVRNPLGVIRSAAQGIGETLRPDDLDGQRACRFITTEIDRLNGVMSSLLAYARPLDLHPQPIAVTELLDRAALLAGHDLDRKRMQLRLGGLGVPPVVLADPDLATQALLDLLTNAVESSPAESEVSLAARAEGDTVAIEVIDRGPGVPEELRERIFEPFFTTRRNGTGLGLAVARHIAEAHGGQIRVADAAAGGSCFTLFLPRAAPSGVP